MEYYVEMRRIQKRFGNVHAIKDGEFNLKRGEICSLIGENGAGKSTIMKILYGIHPLDGGEIFIDGKKQEPYDTKQAIDMGFGMVHQEFMLVKELTVLENIILGFEPKKRGMIDISAAKKTIQQYIDEYGFDVHLEKRILEIPVGEAQKVEILKTLYRGANTIILDEPTAVLTPQETTGLFQILDLLKHKGMSIVFISHKLNEVIEISDRITVMRDGTHVATIMKSETDIPDLAKKMVGREIKNTKRPEQEAGEVVLQVDDIYVSAERELSKIRGLSFELRKGEVLGIAGVDGNGQNELVEAITGLRHVEKGRIALNGVPIQNLSVAKNRACGIAHIPDDRNTRGLNKGFTIRENLIGNVYNKRPYAKFGVLNRSKIDEFAQRLVEKHDIRPADYRLMVGNLSGGNAQKVVFAREISSEYDVFIASQPTRGVDIGSIESIRNVINEIKQNGKAILLISADLEEIFALSDRILVMYEGQIAGIVPASVATEQEIGLMMTGGSGHE